MSKRSAAILLLLCLLFSLCGCGPQNRSYDKAEAEAALQALLPLSAKAEELLFGQGLLPDEEAQGLGNYKPATEESLQYFGVRTVEDIRKKVLEVYTPEYAEILFQTKLSGVTVEGSIASVARYYQEMLGEVGSQTPGRIMVHQKERPLLVGRIEYHAHTIKALYSEGEHIVLSVGATVYNEKGDLHQERVLTVKLLETEEGYRLDTPTYLVYSAYETSIINPKKENIL